MSRFSGHRRRGLLVTAVTLAILALSAGLWRLRDRGLGWETNRHLPPPGATPAALALPSLPTSSSFYDDRLRLWSQRKERQVRARVKLDEHELEWISTPQDARIAPMVSSETGFDVWGVETQLAEIPPGWHTGRHRHGEEAIYIVHGEGFAVVDDLRYDFAAGTTIGIPFGAPHQLFNTGAGSVRYLSATPFPLEEYLGIHPLEQLDVCGATETLPDLRASEDGLDERGRRIRLDWSQTLYRGPPGWLARLEGWVRTGIDTAAGPQQVEHPHDAAIASRLTHHEGWVRTMGDAGQMGFPNRLITMSGFLIDEPGSRSGKHAHNEAVLWVAQGRGHSVIDGVEIPWRAGTSIHIQGPQTVHQHFNTGTEPAIMLRIVNELRPYVEDVTRDVFPRLWHEPRGGMP